MTKFFITLIITQVLFSDEPEGKGGNKTDYQRGQNKGPEGGEIKRRDNKALVVNSFKKKASNFELRDNNCYQPKGNDVYQPTKGA